MATENLKTVDSILARLEKGFQEQQDSFLATRDDVNTLKSAYNVIQRDMNGQAPLSPRLRHCVPRW